MCPAEAKIFLVEDDVHYSRALKTVLNLQNHTVIITATTLESALEQIPILEENGINVAIVDGNLTRGGANGTDGETIAVAIHKECPNISVIGHSYNRDLRNADYNCQKGKGPEAILDTVTNA